MHMYYAFPLLCFSTCIILADVRGILTHTQSCDRSNANVVN